MTGDYPEEKQEKLGRFLAGYVGFDFDKGVMAVSAHPFTTNLHNKDVRITTHYTDRVDSSLFSVIHEAGHGIYELGIRDDLSLTPVGQGASMGMHESQSRFLRKYHRPQPRLLGAHLRKGPGNVPGSDGKRGFRPVCGGG